MRTFYFTRIFHVTDLLEAMGQVLFEHDVEIGLYLASKKQNYILLIHLSANSDSMA
jgi:hypothetical protein